MTQDLLDQFGDSVELIDEHTLNGFDCVVTCVRENHYCGYVSVPPELIEEITWTGSVDNRADITVHGGITFGPTDDGWVGFDTAHAGDACLDEDGAVMNDGFISTRETIWKPSDVRDELERLTDQLSEQVVE